MNSMPATLTLNLNYSCRISHILLVYYIQGEVQSRSHKIESMIQDFEEKESLLLRKIAGLELAKERIEEGAVSDLEQLRIEVTCSFGWSLQKGFLMLYQSWALQTINCIRHDMVEDLGLSWFTLFIFRLSDNTHVDFVWKTWSISNWFVYTFYGHITFVRICGEVGGMFFCLAA